MAKVDKNDLNNINSNSIFLEQLSSENQSLINSLKQFNTNSPNILKGSAYDAVRNRISFYIDAFEKQSLIFDNLKHNITVLNNAMINYMEEFSSLDDTYIDQTRTTIENAEKQLAYLESQVNNSKLNSTVRNQISNAIIKLKQEIIRLKKILEKLVGLKPKDNELDTQFSNTKQDIDAFCTAISKITITKYV